MDGEERFDAVYNAKDQSLKRDLLRKETDDLPRMAMLVLDTVPWELLLRHLSVTLPYYFESRCAHRPL